MSDERGTDAERSSGDSEPPVRLISATDLVIACGIAAMTVVAWCLPEKTWQRIARMAAPLAVAIAFRSGKNLRRIHEFIGDHPLALSAKQIQLDTMRGFIVENLRVLRSYRPGGWNPEIELEGVEHLEAGLQRGRGVILWVAHVHAYSLVAKMALHRAGYQVSHLSLWRHGYSETRFGIRFLNPVRTRIEQRYLRERVVIAPHDAKPAMQTLRERLSANGIVSIAATADAKRPALVPLLNGEVRLAVGAPYLAHQVKAVLLPVFPVEQDDGRFTVVIGPPLENEQAASTRQYLEWATRKYVALFEPYLLNKPAQWQGWFHL